MSLALIESKYFENVSALFALILSKNTQRHVIKMNWKLLPMIDDGHGLHGRDLMTDIIHQIYIDVILWVADRQ